MGWTHCKKTRQNIEYKYPTTASKRCKTFRKTTKRKMDRRNLKIGSICMDNTR